MRFSVFILIMLTFFKVQAIGDVYFITFIKGDIVQERTAKPLKVGDQILPQDKLIFKQKDAYAALISPSKGRFTMSATAAKPNTKGEFMSLLEASLSPVPTVKKLSTRAGAITNSAEMVNYFYPQDSTGKVKYLIIDSAEVKIGSQAFPMNNENFFYIRYLYNGETVNKKLNFKSDTLVLDRAIFKVDTADILKKYSGPVKLYYYTQKPEAKSTLITETELLFVNSEQLKSELNVLASSLKHLYKSDQEKIRNEMFAHVLAMYGKPDPGKLNKIIDEVIKK